MSVSWTRLSYSKIRIGWRRASWYARNGGATIADSILERLVHNGMEWRCRLVIDWIGETTARLVPFGAAVTRPTGDCVLVNARLSVQIYKLPVARNWF